MDNNKKSDADGNEESEVEVELDEHIWTSPKNAESIVLKLAASFSKIDSEQSDIFDKNAEVYVSKIRKLDEKFKDIVANANRKTIIFEDRFPFRYFADEYGLDYFAAFPGCSAEAEPSAKTLAFLIDKINSEKIPVIFHIELSSSKMADSIAEATGAKVRILNAAHNISKSDFDNGKTYVDLFTDNVKALEEALSSMRICKKFKTVTIVSALTAIVCFFIGVVASYIWSVPTGASVVLVNLGVFIIFWTINTISKRKVKP